MSVVSKLQIVLEATTTAFDRGLRSAQRSLDGFARRTEQLHERMDRFARRNADALQGLQNAGAIATVGLGMIAYGIKGAVDEAVKFEQSMAEVKKVVDFDTPQAFKKMQDDIIGLSQKLPMAADQIAQIMAAAGQAGIAQAELFRFTESAVKMGVAFDITAEQAGQAMAEMRVAFKMSQDEVETLADKINYLGNTTPNAADKVLEVVQRIGSLGGIAGVSADQIAALAGSITAVEPDVAATGIKNMMIYMTKGAGATKSQKEAFDQLGLSAEKVAKNMQIDSMGTFLDVIERIKKLPKDLQVATINDIFGTEALPIIAQYVDNTETLRKNLEAMGDASFYAGSMLAEFEGMAGTTQAQMQTFGNNITAVKIALGSAFLPTLNNVMQAMTPILQSMTDFASNNPELVATITAVTAGVLGFVATLGGLALAFTAVTSGFGAIIAIGGFFATMISGVISAVSSAVGMVGAFGSALAMLGFPVTAVIAGVTALIAVGVALYKNWDEVKTKATEIFNGLPAPVQEAVQNIKSIFTGVSDFINGAMSKVIPIFEQFGHTVKAKFAELKPLIGVVFEGIKAYLSAWINSTKAIFTAGLTVFASVFNAGFALIKNAFTTTFNVIKALVRGDMQGVASAIRTGLTNAVSIIRTMIGNIVGAFKNLGSQLLQAGRDAIQGFINGVKGKMSEALNVARDMANKVYQTVKSALDIHSPSRKMKKLGKHTAEGMAQGIKKATPKAVKQAKKMADNIQKTVADAVAGLKKEIALFGNDNPINALKYDIGIGKYKGANTAELEALTAQKHQLERNKTVLDEIAGIHKEISTHGFDRLQLLEWEIIHTNKYKGVADNVLDNLKAKTAEQMAFNKALEEQNKIAQANERSKSNYDSLQKQIDLFGNQSKLAEFDYDWQNGAFSGADNMLLLRERSAIAKLEHLQHQANTKNAFDDMTKSMAGELSPLAKLQKELDDRLKIIKDYEDSHTNVELQAQQARQQAEQVYLAAKTNLMLDGYQNVFHGISGMTKSFFGEQSGIYRAMFAMEKGFAIAKAIIALKANIAEASKTGFPKNIPIIAGAVSQGMGIINDIRSIAMPVGQAHDGIMSVPKSGTWNLEKGERVLPKHTAQNLDNTLNRLQSNSSGQVINVNVTVNSDGGDVQSSHDMGKNLGHAIKLAVQAELQKERRQGGLLYGR
ncbi:phage tail tape measure protein [Moraxella sp. VT-16-12]|uniref:phage tail tape measure protein n=1 Tax=Moraxella sp. VT-16-12 TaxID=2014877 RepID=UPI000B7E3D84|nr:phage tail tape measure protein [Moraxella sp. VT-16-12]TWV81510.1 phage tail tape measure protein [Moraxella sp. VT-16-12]